MYINCSFTAAPVESGNSADDIGGAGGDAGGGAGNNEADVTRHHSTVGFLSTAG